MQPRHDAEFRALRRRVSRFPRMHGYYLIDLVSIEALRAAGRSEEQILDTVLEHFDDEPWPPADRRPDNVSWTEHEVDRSRADEVAIRALVGGRDVGHTRETMPADTARDIWREFEALFDERRRYYAGMGLGNHAYSYLHGVVVVDRARAGILWVVEND